MNTSVPRHSRNALIFLIAAIVAALLVLPLLRAVGMAQWPVFALAGLINLGAAWHLGQWARQQGRAAWAFGGPALLGTVASMWCMCCWRPCRPWHGRRDGGVPPVCLTRGRSSECRRKIEVARGGCYCLTRVRTATVTWKMLFRCLSCTWPGQAHCVEYLFVQRT